MITKKKLYGFLMFSEGREKVHWEQMVYGLSLSLNQIWPWLPFLHLECNVVHIIYFTTNLRGKLYSEL